MGISVAVNIQSHVVITEYDSFAVRHSRPISTFFLSLEKFEIAENLTHSYIANCETISLVAPTIILNTHFQKSLA